MAPTQTHSAAHATVAGKMSVLDRFLPVWIIAAMAVGLLLGRLVPGLAPALDAVKIGSVSLPIALGLLQAQHHLGLLGGRLERGGAQAIEHTAWTQQRA